MNYAANKKLHFLTTNDAGKWVDTWSFKMHQDLNGGPIRQIAAAVLSQKK